MITLRKSPDLKKKWRVTFPDGEHVDFGLTGYSDYTLHKDMSRMASYVRRHGGKTPKNPTFKSLLRVNTSDKEKWGKRGIRTAGFWSRWLTWSHPSINDAVKHIESTYDVSIRRIP